MKKFKILLLIALCFILLPFRVQAEEFEETELSADEVDEISLEEEQEYYEDCIQEFTTFAATYEGIKPSYYYKARNQLDSFSKKIYDRLSQAVADGTLQYGVGSLSNTVSANSVMTFTYQTKEEAVAKIKRGEGIVYTSENLNNLLYDTVYRAYAAFDMDHPEAFYLKSNGFKFTAVGETSETKTKTIKYDDVSYLSTVVITVRAAYDGKTISGKKVYFKSFIEDDYAVINGDDYLAEDTYNKIEAEKAVINNTVAEIKKLADKNLSELPSDATENEKKICAIGTVNDWMVDNTYYNKYIQRGLDSYAGSKIRKISSVLVPLQASDSSPVSAYPGYGDVNAPVCTAFAKTLQYCSRILGYEDVTPILGYTTRTGTEDGGYKYTGSHMWNYVLLDGSWYAIDSTWNVSSKNYRKYFLCGSDTIASGSSKFSSSHYPVGAFWANNIGYIEKPELSADAYSGVTPVTPTPEPAASSFVRCGDNVYYYDSNAKMVTGFRTIDNNRYYFSTDASEKGVLQSGFFNVGNYTYYRDASKDSNGSYEGIAKGYVTLSEDNYDVTDETEGSYYFHKQNGKILKGWQTVIVQNEGSSVKKRFYFGKDGRMDAGSNGVLTVSGVKYYVDEEDGSVLSGLIEKDGKYYYAQSNGKAVTGVKRIKYTDGKYYYFYFNENGEAVTDSFVSHNLSVCYYDESGRRVKLNGFVKKDSKWLYFANSFYAKKGFASIVTTYKDEKTGISTLKRGRYYFDYYTGEMAVGQVSVRGKSYTFSDDAYMAFESKDGQRGMMIK